MASDLARRAFATMMKAPAGGSESSGPKAPSADAVAGKRFAEALGLKDADGAKIAAAFRTMQAECAPMETEEAPVMETADDTDEGSYDDE